MTWERAIIMWQTMIDSWCEQSIITMNRLYQLCECVHACVHSRSDGQVGCWQRADLSHFLCFLQRCLLIGCLLLFLLILSEKGEQSANHCTQRTVIYSLKFFVSLLVDVIPLWAPGHSQDCQQQWPRRHWAECLMQRLKKQDFQVTKLMECRAVSSVTFPVTWEWRV